MPCPVVGIGASAGGLEAVSELLATLPATTGMAFVLVQHLDPAHASMLAEILGKKTAMPVTEARDGMTPAPNHFYVIPPNAVLTLAGDSLRVAERTGGRNPRAIDTLFRSLAAERGRQAACVLLSGTGSDGTRGAQEIKEAGGIVLVQEPASAAFEAMPQSAIRAGVADAILFPADLAQRLAELAIRLIAEGNRDEDAAEPSSEEAALWARIIGLLHGATGIDFAHYKRSTLQRRIGRRIGFRRAAGLAEYAQILEREAGELNALAGDVLIGVTSFFRDAETFEGLANVVFPALLERRETRDPLRFWVPGCSSGEELYSIAICLMEYLGERASRTPVQLFGTDASEAAILRAREACYPAGIEAEVSPERLLRYFVKTDDHYVIAKPIRDLCVFARHDVTRDPPFSRVDLVSCRNLLIYLEGTLQRQVIAQFHYALNPGGFLLLGPSEAIGASADLFEATDKKRRVFRRREVPGRGAQIRPARAALPGLPAVAASLGAPHAASEAERVQREADRLLLLRYAPAAIVVDDDLNVHQFRGDTGRFLAHAPGPASLHLEKLAPPALLVALVPALREARGARPGTSVRRKDVRLEVQGRARRVNVEVSPFRLPDSGSRYLVILEEADGVRAGGLGEALLGALARRSAPPGEAAAEIEELRRELVATREFMQSSAEEHEAAKEELKSLHEEALSANEEFQSTNEELETAKEELQSANEELVTTNDELRTRNEQLSDAGGRIAAARDYAEAIVTTARHPLVVLDGSLRVRSANPDFYRLFRVNPQDTVGTLLYQLGGGEWNIPELRQLLEETLSKSESVESYRVDQTFSGIGPRILLVNARRLVGRKPASELILLGIEDATERLGAVALAEADRKKDEFLAMLGHELRNPLAPIRSALDVMREMEVPGSPLRKCIDVIDRQSAHLVRLVDDLLEMSRITGGTLSLERADLQLADVVSRAVEAAQPLIEARKHRLKVTQPQQPVRVHGDLVRLTQLLTNLLNNAAKYTPGGGIIEVTVATDGGEATVTIADNGQGIAPELLPGIFEPFAQRAGSLRTGLGIGLALSRRLAEMHGGTVDARSAGKDKGSTFTVRLPLANQAQPAPSPAAAAPGLPDVKGCKVLVVDDNVDAAQTLQAYLEHAGCKVRCAFDGTGVLPIVRDFAPEVVLLDLAMPDIDGYEVLRRINTAGAKAGVVALTGFAQPADLARMKEAGFQRSLRKPVNSTTLVQAIDAARRSQK